MPELTYKKHYIPLESNPVLFTELIHKIGISQDLEFHDVISIDDSEALAFVPRPVLALILVFPTSQRYNDHIAQEDFETISKSKIEDKPPVWFKQTINNACGLYAILHAICNGLPREYICEPSPPRNMS